MEEEISSDERIFAEASTTQSCSSFEIILPNCNMYDFNPKENNLKAIGNTIALQIY
jgi:hypothetical protein